VVIFGQFSVLGLRTCCCKSGYIWPVFGARPPKVLL